MILKHQFAKMANLEFEWYLPDLKTTYEKNLIENFEKLKENNWLDYEKFSYKFNNLGFRSDSTYAKSLLALGCSYTFGVGIPYQFTWPYIVSQKTNLNCLNCGIPGSSPYSSFRIGWYLLKEIEPDIVVFLCPPNDRMAVINKDSMYDIGPWYFGTNSIHYHYFNKTAVDFYSNFIMNEENLILQEELSRLALRQICQQKNIKYLDLYLKDFEFIDLARELAHPGIKSNQQFANHVLSLI